MYVLNKNSTTDLSFIIEQINHLDGTDLDKLFEAQHDKRI